MNALVREPVVSTRTVSFTLTTREIRSIAMDALERRGQELGRALHAVDTIIDRRDRWDVCLIGTVLAPAVTALRAHGMMIGYTYGDLQTALGFSAEHMHTITCDCGHGTFVEYRTVAHLIGIAALSQQCIFK